MSSNLKVHTIWPNSCDTAYVKLEDGEVIIFPKLAVDTIESLTGDIVNIEGWDASTYVHVTGNQTIDGVKTFLQIPVLPNVNPTLDNQAARKKYVDDMIGTAMMPTGAVISFAGTTAPTGFLLCDGTVYSTVTYANLFAIIGYAFGGTGFSFNVPNLKGKVVVGKDSTQTEFNTLGKTGGEKTHTLTIPEMPTHDHTYRITQFSAIASGSGLWDGSLEFDTQTGAAGESHAHNNLQPYLTLNYIIKY